MNGVLIPVLIRTDIKYANAILKYTNCRNTTIGNPKLVRLRGIVKNSKVCNTGCQSLYSPIKA